MRSIRGWLGKMIEKEVRLQLNVIFFGRKAGPRQGGLTRVRRKPDKARAVGLGNVSPLPPARKAS